MGEQPVYLRNSAHFPADVAYIRMPKSPGYGLRDDPEHPHLVTVDQQDTTGHITGAELDLDERVLHLRTRSGDIRVENAVVRNDRGFGVNAVALVEQYDAAYNPGLVLGTNNLAPVMAALNRGIAESNYRPPEN